MCPLANNCEDWKECKCVLWHNAPSGQITNDAATEWCEDIQKQLIAGYGFLPFIGAGLSVPSGAPQLAHLHPYLVRCIASALDVEIGDHKEKAEMRPWNPRTDQWPPFTRTERGKLKEWLDSVRDVWTTKYKPDSSHPDPEAAVYQQAIGAMAEWRAALLFLARVTRYKERTGFEALERLTLDAPRQDVIDACLREVMKGREPTLGHRMLAVLGVTLRLDIILTTNFDTLLERAFHAARNPVTLFELHLNSTLPPRSALLSHRSLIKLHGTLHSLRADYTLDALPSESDCKTFLEYLMRPGGRVQSPELAKEGIPPDQKVQNHLLAMGFSAGERRTRALIEYAWEHLPKDFTVYWLCHSDSDVQRAGEVTHDFHEARMKNRDGREWDDWRGSCILRFPHLGLLFLQLWQTLRRGLPTNGIVFPSVSRMVMPPLPRSKSPTGDTKERGDTLRDLILNKIKDLNENSRSCKTIVVTSPKNVRGVTSVCADVYQKREDDRDFCLWIDMNDISSVDDLFDKLLDAAYYRLGIENWKPVYVLDSPAKKAEELRKLAQDSSSPWVIFLNARETPGANTSDDKPERLETAPNGWFDLADNGLSDCPSTGLVAFLKALCDPQQFRDISTISVVLLCRQPQVGDAPIITELRKGFESLVIVNLPNDAVALGGPEESSIEESSITWTEGKPERLRFLHALLLMQRPRYLATIWSSAALATDGKVDLEEPAQWILALEERGLVRHKPGGFIWLHSPVRNRLRTILTNLQVRENFLQNASDKVKEKIKNYLEKWVPEPNVADIHDQLCRWYQRVLDASNAHHAVFETLYHACMCAEANLKLRAFVHARDKIELAASLLRTHGFLLQIQPDSRGSCRYLEYVRDILCPRLATASKGATAQGGDVDGKKQLEEAIRLLRIRCTETMRSIAREVGKDGRAYKRHLEVRALLARKPITETDKIKAKEFYAALFQESPFPQSLIDPVIEWIRWWRWSGMLALASRSYEGGRSALLKALLTISRYRDNGENFEKEEVQENNVSDNELSDEFEKVIDYCRGTSGEVFHRPVKDMQQLRLELLRVIEQIIGLRLDECSMARRRGKPLPADDLDALRKLIEQSSKLVECVVSNDHATPSSAMTVALWCQTRLKMHNSICACLSASDASGSNEALRLLADAETCSNYHDPRRQGTDRTVLELYRAEVRLLEADARDVSSADILVPKDWAWPIPEDPQTPIRPRSFARLRHQFPNEGVGDNYLNTWFPDENLRFATGELRKVQVSVQDALRFLARAEQDLLSRRRHLWWTTRFASRKLTAIAMSVWATILEKQAPIPFLGLEAAPRGTPTAADTLLKDSIRMIQFDAYRLATIVEAYAACATALRFRLMLDNAASSLLARQRCMQQELSDAIKSLQDVQSNREKADADARNRPPEDAGMLNQNAIEYVKEVIDGCKEVAKALPAV